MKENKLAKLSLEQLQKEKQKSKGALIGLLIVCVILITFMIVLTIKTKRFFLLASLGGLIPALSLLAINNKKIEKEIESRQTSHT